MRDPRLINEGRGAPNRKVSPLNVVPLRALVREGSNTILKLDSWLVVICKDGSFHLDGCDCADCLETLDEYLKAA